jgi:hypothetical protein
MKQGLIFAITLLLANCGGNPLKGDKPKKTPDDSNLFLNRDSIMLMQMADSMLKTYDKIHQAKGEIRFTADYENKRDSFTIHLTAKNMTDSMYYFHIGALGWVNNKWTTLLNDLNALGEMDFAYPKPLKPGLIYSTQVSLAAVRKEFEIEKKFQKVKFILFYYKKQDFFSPFQEMYSQEFSIPANTKQ